MKLPEPKVALDNICSVIYNNVLYTYSSGAFQSLSLEEGAQWKTLAQGEAVTGAVCVGSNPTDASKAGLYIVGGKGTSTDYHGLQKFTYATGKWESISPQDHVTQDRLLHGATYLPGTDQIIMYGGSQDGYSGPSTQTFVVGASAPYSTRAYESSAPPVVNPIVLTWSDTQAVVIGGSTTNNKVMLFNPDTKWTDSGATLGEPLLKDTTAIRAIIMNGDDGSKSLYTFDLSVAPNVVKRMVLIDAAGTPVTNSQAVSKAKARRVDGEIEKRASLTLSDWPAYNSTLAPTGTRSNYALAQGSDGTVVFSGGSGAVDDVLCIFNARQNSWEDAAQKLNEQEVLATSESTSSTTASSTATSSSSKSSTSASSMSTLPASASASASASAAATLSASASSSASTETAAAAGAPAAVSANAILGIVLGTITGIMLLLGLILFCIRKRRGKNQQNVEGGQDPRGMSPRGFPDEKAGLGYGNDDFNSGPHFRGHQQQDSAGSFSSMAILMGKVNGNAPKSAGVARSGSKRDTSNSFFKSTIGKPLPQMNEAPALAPPSRDEKGVSFAADVVEPRPTPRGAPVGRAGETRRSSGWNRYWSGGSALNILGFGNSKRTTVDSETSHYSNTPKNRITQDSATVPPLHLITQDLSTVPPIQHDGRPELSRVVSGSPTVSNYSNQIPFRDGVSGKIESPRRPTSNASSGYSSGIPESVRDTWDPTGPSRPWGADRAPSSVYAESLYPTSLAPSLPQRQTQTSAPNGVSQQPPLALAATSSDMSWLNLGEINKQNRL
ncbi:pre-mRNA splicing factor CLF1 [Colletotrichum fioriniae PJ7]|uniref:Pre-mRNA splicing factor CLF1 n=1 Tax=Colletotrichum fioriniae PJ7 TaxID=1445577 RepID=A0A010QSW8_9PEZI|nr:pre-mRNA splicing factor CLF1 [Colletotrichum fioriniae PJ7]